MTMDPKIFIDPRESEEAELVKASTADVVATLLAFLDMRLPIPYVDPERVEFAGLAVGKTHHKDVDAALESWLAADPVERRIELVAWFVYGYWAWVKAPH